MYLQSSIALTVIYRIPFICFLQFTLFVVSIESWLETINTYLSEYFLQKSDGS